MSLRKASALLAALALVLPGTVQARCVVWNAIKQANADSLRHLAVRHDGSAGVELAYLGVADGPRGAQGCDLTIYPDDYSVRCDWSVASEAEGGRLIASLQREIEHCLGVAMTAKADYHSPETGSAMLFQRELDLVRGTVETMLELTLFTHPPGAGGEARNNVVFDYARSLP